MLSRITNDYLSAYSARSERIREFAGAAEWAIDPPRVQAMIAAAVPFFGDSDVTATRLEFS